MFFVLVSWKFLLFSPFQGFLEMNDPQDERKNSGRHLGVDIALPDNVPIKVVCPVDRAVVFHAFFDPSRFNGWGGRVILDLGAEHTYQDCRYLIMGHLAKSGLPKKGDVFRKGDKIANLAELDQAGSWFRHLHVQLASEMHLKFFPGDEIEELDGYCHDPDEDVSILTADPTGLLFTPRP